jgi:2-polyprenyl-3-methyl-5-hydroxy-6-metoxy-1,4-benzoquinol methylase
MFLTSRDRQPELMDEPDVAADLHADALRGLARINWLSGSARILWPALARAARATSEKPLRVLDLACGGGDVVVALARRAQRRQLPIEFAGCDKSAFAIETARRRAEAHGADVDFFPLDVLQESLPDDYDVIMCSLFLHHLTEHDAVLTLHAMSHGARKLVLVNDLRRSQVGFALAWLGCHVLTRSRLVHVDGPRSVRGAFSLTEFAGLARQADMQGATVARTWPQRMLLHWERA